MNPQTPTPPATQPYCTLFLCRLEQRTPLSIGGRDDDADATLHDLPLARDGMGRPVLTGRTLAGALVATARTFLQVPDDISWEGGAPDDKARPPSLWSVWNAHLCDRGGKFLRPEQACQSETDARQGVALRQDTRAAASGMLFDAEVLPAGVHWGLLAEVWHPAGGAAGGDGAQPGRRAAAILALALREWARDRCWIGRRVSRGLGWMRLVSCDVVELPRTPAPVDAWPKADLEDLDAVWQHAGTLGARTPLSDYLAAEEAGSHAGVPQPRRAYVRWPLRLSTGAHQPTKNGPTYGLDVISIGGHSGSAVTAEGLQAARIVRAQEQTWKSYAEAFAPDFTVSLKPGTSEPTVPGSAVAGAWRHFLSRRERAAGRSVLDPSTGRTYPQKPVSSGPVAGPEAPEADPVAELFGRVLGTQSDSSRLLIGDATMTAGTDWKVTLLEKVALDEFTQGAFPTAKFNRMAVLHGQWDFEVVQEVELDPPVAAQPERIRDAVASVQALLAAAEQRRVAVGGGEFRAYGHVPVELRDGGCQWALAGEDWRPWPLPEGPPRADGAVRDDPARQQEAA